MHKPSIIVFCAALAGCSPMPDYRRPEPPIPAQWPASVPVDGARQAAVLDWHDFFPDPRLQALIAAALEHNRDMKIAAARVEEARALYGIARADRLPGVDATAGAASARTPGTFPSRDARSPAIATTSGFPCRPLNWTSGGG